MKFLIPILIVLLVSNNLALEDKEILFRGMLDNTGYYNFN